MSSATRTGLIPTPKRNLRLLKKTKSTCEPVPRERLPKFEAMPMALSLRPFGGIYNPFAKGCSVLCNHPAPTAMKDVIHQMKQSLATEVRNQAHAKEFAAAHQQQQQQQQLQKQATETDNIPEDLFRRYTDTDSRPLTPTPTVTSIHTRTSVGSLAHNRRCITPELGKNEMNQRKKIILDLRRSHSQETLYWKPSSELSQSVADESITTKPKSAGAAMSEEKIKTKRQKSEEQKTKSAASPITAQPEEGVEIVKKTPQMCINELSLDDEDVRRGKKRKKLKSIQATTTFHLSQDPETQVATLGPDSLNPSTRPSLIPDSGSLLANKEKRESEAVLLKGSFLTNDAFQVLKTELDVDTIENTFGRYLNRALREAIKYIPPKPPKPVPKVAEEMEKLSLEKKSKMPRKFSKSATRFDVPLNLASLESMSVLDYLSKFVWVSRQRKQLYKRVFLRYLSKIEDSLPPTVEPKLHMESTSKQVDEDSQLSAYLPRGEYKERTMAMCNLPQALEDVLEFHGTPENIAKLLKVLDYENVRGKELDFRAWCGIVSFAERYSLDDPTGTDSCDELEKADFNSMEERLGDYNISPMLRQVFDVIRSTHNLPF